MYKVTLHGGVVLDNLTINGNNFVSATHIDPEVFTPEALSHVEFSGDGPYLPESADNLVFVQCIPWEGGSAFIIRELSEAEIEAAAKEQAITDLQLAMAELYETLGGV